ncbi:hypothetical protein P5G61_20050 [Paenibacillus sp. F6_3S_P_1C]|uniref:Uncharacterized protein n=1 Tax=Paenibacillus vandeheii TaxID=3035917 RepID=A0ABT8JEL4_9BACL|nr:hypothetical protein [Paenibacillus vandeheii]MDN4603545.1 hypothetical protein [Paenibacillus vandeheii]
MFAQNEIQIWENEQSLELKNNKKFIDPRKEKLKEIRKGIKSTHFNKESKPARKQDYRLYRTKMKRLMYSEQYDLLHNYKRTSGWLTW